jgi:hypothetical protein
MTYNNNMPIVHESNTAKPTAAAAAAAAAALRL